MTRTVVLLGHGSRAPGAGKGIEAAAEDLAASTGWDVRVAHMELAVPSLGDVVGAVASRGEGVVVVLPYFLHLGVHLREDIPAILDRLRGEHPGMEIRLAPPLGYDASFARILRRRAMEVLC